MTDEELRILAYQTSEPIFVNYGDLLDDQRLAKETWESGFMAGYKEAENARQNRNSLGKL